MGRVRVRVVPRASRNERAGVDAEGRVRIRLTAPPVEGEANRALVRFVAGVLGVPRSRVRVVVGAASRTKVVEVDDRPDEELMEILSKAD